MQAKINQENTSYSWRRSLEGNRKKPKQNELKKELQACMVKSHGNGQMVQIS